MFNEADEKTAEYTYNKQNVIVRWCGRKISLKSF